MQIQKIQKNKKKGFVILFAVVATSIILSVSLGIANIAFKEIRFYTSVKDSNNAFFNADTGVECALMNDKNDTITAFPVGGTTGTVRCLGNNITVSGSSPIWNFVVSQLGDGSSPKGCAKVTVNKTNPSTEIISKGYNEGGTTLGACTPLANTLERQLRVTYN
mgnify:CR=1 FL=1